MALLLASVALPAMCGACVDFAAKPACGEKHADAANAIERHSAAMDGHCADCGEQPGITAKQGNALGSEFMFLDCARRICVQAGEESAAIYSVRVDEHRLVGDRATFVVSAELASLALRTVHLNVFGSGRTAPGNSAYQPFLVSLKI